MKKIFKKLTAYNVYAECSKCDGIMQYIKTVRNYERIKDNPQPAKVKPMEHEHKCDRCGNTEMTNMIHPYIIRIEDNLADANENKESFYEDKIKKLKSDIYMSLSIVVVIIIAVTLYIIRIL